MPRRPKPCPQLFGKIGLLGLQSSRASPLVRAGPALACKIVLTDSGDAELTLGTSDSRGTSWVSSGKLSVPIARELPATTPDGKELTAEEQTELKTALLADAMAEGVLSRLVRAQLTKGPRVQGKETYRIRSGQREPTGLERRGAERSGRGAEARPTGLAGISLPPLEEPDAAGDVPRWSIAWA